MSTSLRERLREDLTAAMKQRDEVTTSTLRMALTAVTNAEVAGESHTTLDDDQLMAVLLREAKQRRESAEVFASAGRDELAAQERAQLAVIERYLPAAVDEAELDRVVAEEVAVATAAGQSGRAAMGPVIKAVRARLGAGADGSRVSAAVRQALDA